MVFDVLLPAPNGFLIVRIRVGRDARPTDAEEMGKLVDCRGLSVGIWVGGDDCIIDSGEGRSVRIFAAAEFPAG